MSTGMRVLTALNRAMTEVGASLEQSVAALEKEIRALRETIEAQAVRLEELERQVGALEEGEQQDGNDASKVDGGHRQKRRPPGRGTASPTLVRARWRSSQTRSTLSVRLRP